MRSLAALALLVVPSVAWAADPPLMPRLALTYTSLTVVRVNPLGLQEQADLGLQLRLWDSDSTLLRDSFAGIYFSPLLTPAFLAPAVAVKVQPLAVLRVEAKLAWLKYLGTFNLLQSYPSPDADYSDTAIKARGDEAYDPSGYSLTLVGELRGKVGPVVARSRLQLAYQDLALKDGDRVFYDQYYDILASGSGWLLANDLDVLWQIPLDEATGQMLMAGARYSLATPLYGAADYPAGAPQAHDNGPFHRLGPMFVFTFFDEPGAAFNKPSIIAIFNWHLEHRFRTGADTSAALPYMVIAFAFTGELARLID